MTKYPNSMTSLLFVLFSLGLAACTNPHTDNVIEGDHTQYQGIIGGKEPAANTIAYNSTVAIGVYDKAVGHMVSFCTGVVVSKDLVLTATHCMKSDEVTSQKGKPSVVLYFGKAYKNYDKNLERTATHWKTNDKYKPILEPEFGMTVSAMYDVAVIKVEGGVPASALPVPIGVNAQLKKDEEITAAGWGLIHEKKVETGFTVGLTEEEVLGAVATDENGDSDKPTDRLYETKISYISLWETHMVFQQSDTTGVCRGDSGGPAYYKTAKHGYVVIGTVRGAHAFSDCSGLVEYTNLTYNIDFIKSAASLLGGSPVTVVNLKN